MSKSKLFRHFAERFGIRRADAAEFLDQLQQLTKQEQLRCGEFVLPGVAKLVVQNRERRMSRNPATGASVEIPAQQVIKARIAKPLRTWSGVEAVTPYACIAKWRPSELKERSASQEHFLDLCRLLGEPTPAEADPTGETYCVELGARKATGGDGWASSTCAGCWASRRRPRQTRRARRTASSWARGRPRAATAGPNVWKRPHFAWEYKGQRADVDAAFGQLRQYALPLENPPLLIVSRQRAVPDPHELDEQRLAGRTSSSSTTWPTRRPATG